MKEKAEEKFEDCLNKINEIIKKLNDRIDKISNKESEESEEKAEEKFEDCLNKINEIIKKLNDRIDKISNKESEESEESEDGKIDLRIENMTKKLTFVLKKDHPSIGITSLVYLLATSVNIFKIPKEDIIKSIYSLCDDNE